MTFEVEHTKAPSQLRPSWGARRRGLKRAILSNTIFIKSHSFNSIQFRSLRFLKTPASSSHNGCYKGEQACSHHARTKSNAGCPEIKTSPRKEKKDKKSNKRKKTEESLFDPGRHFPCRISRESVVVGMHAAQTPDSAVLMQTDTTADNPCETLQRRVSLGECTLSSFAASPRGRLLRVGVYSIQGRRQQMEDAHKVLHACSYLRIPDMT